MHRKSQTSNLSDDALLRRAEVLRSGPLADSRHRFQADDDSNRLGQGQQGTIGAALTETFERAESLLAQVQADRPAVPRQDAQQDLRRHHDSQSDEASRGKGRDQTQNLSACSAEGMFILR